MIIYYLLALWLFLPAGFANMAPVLFKNINFLNYPISKKLFGEHKTYRGFFFGILLAVLAAYALSWSAKFVFTGYDYGFLSPMILGLLLGFGALFGDLVKSFFKRRAGIMPGKSWMPWDQIDWIIGAMILVNFYIIFSWQINLTILIVFGLAHPIINYAGYLFKIKKNKF
ncbi:MAG: CDP-archaeol synthase [archaeon]|jgi:CDP-2,3-bis-(O-geranylgeranyl)-sn-glycerol synthase|nr:CDP-archaeol synthase [archaeon]